VTGEEPTSTDWIAVCVDESTGRKPVLFRRLAGRRAGKGARIHYLDNRFVVTVVLVGLDVRNQSTIVGPTAVGARRCLLDNDQQHTGFAVDDEFAALERVSRTERCGLVSLDVLWPSTDRTDTLSHPCWRDVAGVDVDCNSAKVFASNTADRVVWTGTVVVGTVDDVGSAVGLDDESAIAEGTQCHRFGSGTSCALAGASDRQMALWLGLVASRVLVGSGCCGCHWRDTGCFEKGAEPT
jgi:hypothetical protein